MSKREYSYAELPRKQAMVLLWSILVVALCGIVYELIIGTVSSYLLGNSVAQFSLTIGFFMFAMGVGSYVSRYLEGNLVQIFIRVELILALIGGMCSISLFMLFPYTPWLYTTGMFGFISAIGFLVGLEIPILTRIISERTTTRQSISDVLSLDYIGALIGSVAFPLLLLPSLGLITASFAIGLTNAAVALLNVVWLRNHLDNFTRMLGYVIATVILLLTLTISASKITGFAQDHLYFDQVIYRDQTQYQALTVTNTWRKSDIRLFIDGHLQFSQMDEFRYHEALVHPLLSLGKPPESVLILGGGDGLAVREVLKYPSVTKIDLVDLDPAMTRLGAEFAPLVRLNKASMSSEILTVYNQDAFVFVKNAPRKYDRIIIDFPDPHNEALAKLYSVEFYAMVARIMSDDGSLVTQSSSPFFATHSYWTVALTLKEVFPKIISYNTPIPSFGIWGFHIATKQPDGQIRPFPEGLRSITPESFAAAQNFTTDLLPRRELEVNSIFNPTIYERYADDIAGR